MGKGQDHRLHSAIFPFQQGHVEELWGLAAHPSRAQFVTCGQDKLVHLWSSESHQPLWSRVIEVRGQRSEHICSPSIPFLHASGLSTSAGNHTRYFKQKGIQYRDLQMPLDRLEKQVEFWGDFCLFVCLFCGTGV
jgi:WD40 repeat protein